MTRAALALLLCAPVYPLVLGSVRAWDVAFGVVAAAGLLLVLRGHLFPAGPGPVGSLPRRLLRLPLFAAAALKEIALGTWQVALVVLHVRPLRHPGIVAVPYGDRTPGGVVTTAVLLTLSPGEVLVELDDERRAMLLHVIDASDPESIRELHDRFYDRYQRHVLP